jgi:8-oxo-dGTP diphosphatase
MTGDGFVTAEDGRRYWGIYGACGLLLRHVSDQERFFLILRGATEDAGKWGIPGGARNHDEYLFAAAMRETVEEIGYFPSVERILHTHKFNPGGWQYTTFVVETPERFQDLRLNWEALDWGWFTRAELAELDVHPGVLNAIESYDEARRAGMVV